MTKGQQVALAEIIQTILWYSNQIQPLQFIRGDDQAKPGETLSYETNGKAAHQKFNPWIGRWLTAIFPETVELQRKIVSGKLGVDPDDTYMKLAYSAQELGFIIGYLAGCHREGADLETLTIEAITLVEEEG